MILKNLINRANDILGLTINWNDTAHDENYQHLFACARLVVNSLFDLWEVTDQTVIEPSQLGLKPGTIVYGILSEYAFVAGMFNEWKIWQEKYHDGLFKAQHHGKSRIINV